MAIETELDTAACEASWPTRRLNPKMLSWWSFLWIPYIPFGIILCIGQLVYMFMRCFYILSVKGPKGLHPQQIFPLVKFNVVDHLGNPLAAETFSINNWGEAAQADIRRIYCAEHPYLFLDGCLPLLTNSSLIVGEAVAHGITGFLTRPFSVVKKRGMSLVKMLEDWVQNPVLAKNLVVFPQAVTVAQNNFVHFALPTFKFAAAHPNQVELVPVAMSYDMPYPIHLRKANSSYLFDFLLLMMMPYAKVTYALLEPVQLHGRTAEEIKAECESKIVECSLRQCQAWNIDYRDKVKWRHMLTARLHPTYRAFEVSIINKIQSLPGFKIPSLVLHHTIQESTLIFIGACIYFSRWNQLALNAIMRSCIITFALVNFIKVMNPVPRPAWVAASRLKINPYALKRPLRQYDYTFPSGHSAFMACLYATYYFSRTHEGFEFDFPAGVHVALSILTLASGLSRLYLALHWPTDVLCGWILGGLWGWAWGGFLDARFDKLSNVLQIAISLAVAGFFLIVTMTRMYLLPAKIPAEAWCKQVGHELKLRDPKQLLLNTSMIWTILSAKGTLLALYTAGVTIIICPLGRSSWLIFMQIIIGVLTTALVHTLVVHLPAQLFPLPKPKLKVIDTEKSVFQSDSDTSTKTAVSVLPKWTHEYTAAEITSAVLRAGWWLFASSFVLFYITVLSQLVASQIEESYCTVLYYKAIAAYGN
ncbi:acidPPc domain-containing protein [Pseudozyma hubeiensis]|nr:acidPPc domain-containing protein [Pseudozyma hubeiensis]